MQRTTPKKGPDKKNLLPLKIGASAILAVLIVGVFSVTSLQQLVLRNPQLAAVISSVLVDLANGDRLAHNLSSLTMNPILVAAAQAKADDMATKGYFAHKSPEGLNSWYWFKQAGYSFLYAGENLAVDFSDSGDVERAWLASPSHRANLLNGNYTEIGIATAVGTYQGRTTTFVVQMFGTPAKKKVIPVQAARVTPSPGATPTVAVSEPKPVSVLGATTPIPDTKKTERSTSTTVLSENTETYAPLWGFLLTSPRTTLRYTYYLLGLFVVLSLLARTGIEIRKHHTRQVAIALALLALMVGLFFVADRLIFQETQLIPAQNIA